MKKFLLFLTLIYTIFINTISYADFLKDYKNFIINSHINQEEPKEKIKNESKELSTEKDEETLEVNPSDVHSEEINLNSSKENILESSKIPNKQPVSTLKIIVSVIGFLVGYLITWNNFHHFISLEERFKLSNADYWLQQFVLSLCCGFCLMFFCFAIFPF